MKRLLGAVLGTLLSVLLASCGKPADPVVAPPALPPPLRTTSHPPPIEKATPVVRKWEPKDTDIFGRWERPCEPVTTGDGKSRRVELLWVDSTVELTTFLYSGNQCQLTTQLSASKESVMFEDGWYPGFPLLNGVPLPGWRGTFQIRDAGASRQVQECDAVVHLVEENGQRVMYIHWSPTKPVELDRAKHRYVFLGSL